MGTRRRPPDVAIGEWFDVPLPSGGHAAGLIARLNRKAWGAFCYFFGPRRDATWTEAEVQTLRPEDAALRAMVSIRGFAEGSWTRVAVDQSFDREVWALPPFLVGDKSEGYYREMVRVYYDEETLLDIVRVEPSVPEDITLPADELDGPWTGPTRSVGSWR